MADALQVVQEAGAIGALLLFLWGFMRGWWVPGYLYNQLRQDRDRWKNLAIRWGRMEAQDGPDGNSAPSPQAGPHARR